MQTLSDEDKGKQAARRRLESELVILQSDAGRIRRQTEDIAIEIKRIRNDIKRLELDAQSKEMAAKKLETERMLNEGEIVRLKKRMNVL